MATEEIKKQYQKEDACLLNECYSKVDKEIEKLSDDEWTKFYNIILPKKRKECDFIGCAAEFAEFD